MPVASQNCGASNHFISTVTGYNSLNNIDVRVFSEDGSYICSDETHSVDIHRNDSLTIHYLAMSNGSKLWVFSVSLLVVLYQCTQL